MNKNTEDTITKILEVTGGTIATVGLGTWLYSNATSLYISYNTNPVPQPTTSNTLNVSVASYNLMAASTTNVNFTVNFRNIFGTNITPLNIDNVIPWNYMNKNIDIYVNGTLLITGNTKNNSFITANYVMPVGTNTAYAVCKQLNFKSNTITFTI